jgi:hypothetical protein
MHPIAWGRRLGLAACVVIAALTVLPVARHSPAAHASTEGTTVVGASIASSATSLEGLQTATLSVSVHLQDPAGVSTVSAAGPYYMSSVTLPCPCAIVAPVLEDGVAETYSYPAIDSRVVVLALTSGTPQDGTWSGTTTIAAMNQGRWTVTQLSAGSLHPAGATAPVAWTPVDGLALGAQVAVAGANWPELTLRLPPGVVAYGAPYTVNGHVALVGTGVAVPDLPVTLAAGDYSLVATGKRRIVHTDPGGNFSVSQITPTLGWSALIETSQVSPTLAVWQGAAQAVQLPRFVTDGFLVRYFARLQAARSGADRLLTVHFAPKVRGAVLLLQRLSGGQWTQQRRRSAGNTSTFRFVVHAGGTYRVWLTGACCAPPIDDGYSNVVHVS